MCFLDILITNNIRYDNYKLIKVYTGLNLHEYVQPIIYKLNKQNKLVI